MPSWPGVRDDMVNAGATWLDEMVVQDGNWLTSRGPQDMVPFVRALVAFFADPEKRVHSGGFAGDAVSAPQRDAPPQAVLSAMKWLPRPSFRTLALVAVQEASPSATVGRTVRLNAARGRCASAPRGTGMHDWWGRWPAEGC